MISTLFEAQTTDLSIFGSKKGKKAQRRIFKRKELVKTMPVQEKRKIESLL
jgi:hypothetical protein